jgi:phenylacetate-CoA ligase
MEIPGIRQALKIFRKASREVPAYKSFLAKNRINPKNIKSQESFLKLPTIEKQNYILKRPLSNLFIKGRIPPITYASSGSSGTPTFWFHSDNGEKIGGEIHEMIFNKIFGVRKDEPTLVVVCFAMGLWVAGGYTLAASREVSRRGYNLTTVTPGLDHEAILNILKNLAPNFKNLILAGYPPFLMDVALEMKRRKIKLKNRTYFITAGDKFKEEWRDDFLKHFEVINPNSLVSIYGSADGGILGFETPLSIFIRRKAMNNQKLYQAFFKDEAEIPAFVQYNLNHIFFETINDELVFTKDESMPLVRYNIHDIGKIISYENAVHLLKKTGFGNIVKKREFKNWHLPFIVKSGRKDVAVTFYALNIYPENIKSGLEDKRISKLVSGQYFAFHKNTKHNSEQQLVVRIELTPGTKPRREVKELIKSSLDYHLANLNIEYRKLRSVIHNKALPIVELTSYGAKNFSAKGERGILFMKGKKARIVTT